MAGWARYRSDPVQFHPEDLDTTLCTHVIFAFADLDTNGQHLRPADAGDERMLVLVFSACPVLSIVWMGGGR